MELPVEPDLSFIKERASFRRWVEIPLICRIPAGARIPHTGAFGPIPAASGSGKAVSGGPITELGFARDEDATRLACGRDGVEAFLPGFRHANERRTWIPNGRSYTNCSGGCVTFSAT